MLISALFVSCIQKTTVRGLPRVLREDWKIRCLWIVGFLTLTVIAAYTLTLVSQKYLNYDTVVNRKEQHIRQESLDPFAVTVCNLNPTSTRKTKALNIPTLNSYRMMLGTLASQLDLTDPSIATVLARLLSLKGYFEFLGVQGAKAVSHVADDFIVSCFLFVKINQNDRLKIPCGEGAIRPITHHTYFNCYTINTNSTKLDSLVHNYINGISVVLHIDRAREEQELSSYSVQHGEEQNMGVRVAVHPSSVMPDLTVDANSVPPGYLGSLSTEVSLAERAKPPYGNCQQSYTTAYNLFDKKPVLSESLHCRYACVQDHVMAACGCLDSSLPVISSLDLENVSFCGVVNISDPVSTLTRVGCATQIATEIQKSCKTDCGSPCKEIVYKVVPSFMKWPAKQYHLDFYKTMIAPKNYKDAYSVYKTISSIYDNGDHTEANQLLSSVNLIEDNFARVDVLINNDIVVSTVESPRITIYGLISEIGGLLNLYSGITLIVTLEMLELIYLLCPLRNMFSKGR